MEVKWTSLLVHSGCHNKIPQWGGGGGLNNSNVLSHGSGGLKSKIKVLSGLISGESALPGLQMATFSLCPHRGFPLCFVCCGGKRKRDI